MIDFNKSYVKEKKKLKLKNALMLVGLPGVGLASKLAVDYLIDSLEPTHFATIYSPHFPNQVIATKNAFLRPFNFKFYHLKSGKQDIVLLRGDVQPLTVEGQYEVTSTVLNYFQNIGGKYVTTMAGFVTQDAMSAVQAKKTYTPRLFIAGTNKKTLKEVEKKTGAKKIDNYMPIVGLAGLLPSLAPTAGITGTCMLVETGDAQLDEPAATTLVAAFSKLTGKKVKVEKLKKRVDKAKKNLAQLAQPPQTQQMQALPAVEATENQTPADVLRYIR